MSSGILVIAECRDGALKPASKEALAEALRQKGALGGDVSVALIGTKLDDAKATLAASGADKVLVYERADLAHYSPEGYRACAVDAVAKTDAKVVLVAATVLGRELAPLVAGKLDLAYAAECTGLSVEGGALHAVRPVYAGKANVTVSANTDQFVLSLRPNVFDGSLPGGGSASPEAMEVPFAEGSLKAQVTAVSAPSGEAKDVAEADVVVAGGRGTGGPDGWGPLESLARTLGGAVGASRAVVDLGWRPHSEQVGQTGKVVAPKLYIAAGVSGAIQHLAGMRTSKVIVAVNKDPEAPIFKVADYGIVGDLHEVLPALEAALKDA